MQQSNDNFTFFIKKCLLSEEEKLNETWSVKSGERQCKQSRRQYRKNSWKISKLLHVHAFVSCCVTWSNSRCVFYFSANRFLENASVRYGICSRETGKDFFCSREWKKSKGVDVCQPGVVEEKIRTLNTKQADGSWTLTQLSELKSFYSIATILNVICCFLSGCQHIKDGNDRHLICMSSRDNLLQDPKTRVQCKEKSRIIIFKLQFQFSRRRNRFGSAEENPKNIENVCIIRILCKSINFWNGKRWERSQNMILYNSDYSRCMI